MRHNATTVAEIKRMTSEGKSTSMIATALGISRSAVLGLRSRHVEAAGDDIRVGVSKVVAAPSPPRRFSWEAGIDQQSTVC